MKRWLTVKWTRSLIIGLCVAFVLVLADLLVKWAVELNTLPETPIEVIPNFFYINKSYNIAVAFSIGAAWGVGGRALNIIISLVMSTVIFWFYVTHESKLKPLEKVTAVLLGGGAVGNLIDRAFYWEATTGFDGVVDMFQFYLGGGPSAKRSFVNPFATFNFADMCLTIGIVLLLILLIIDLIKNRDTSLEKDPRLTQKPAEVKAVSSSNEEKEAATSEEPAQDKKETPQA